MNKDTFTTPIVNYMMNVWEHEDIDKHQAELMLVHSMHHKVKMKPVAYFKKKLGRQNYTCTIFCRHWVWERNNWRMYVNNEQGISIEVDESLTGDQAKMAWYDFLNTVKQ